MSLPDHLLPDAVTHERIPQDVLEQHQRDRVLSVAAEVFAKRGYPGTTVDHLVAAAKIGVGSFYSLFSGKEDCFLQLYDQITARALARIERAVEGRDWPEQVAAGLATLVDLASAEPVPTRIVVLVARTAGPEAEERHAATLALAADALRRGRTKGTPGDELPEFFEDATVPGAGWVFEQRVADEAIDDRDLFSELVEIVLEPYVGKAAADAAVASQKARK